MPNSTHILVIRLSALGDVAMTVPVIRGLVQTYPNLRLTVVSRRGYQPLFEGIPNVDFLEADVYGKHKGLFGLMKLAKEARALHIHAVADLHNVIRSKILTRNLGFKGKRTATIDKGRAEKKKLTSAAGMGLEKLKTTHQRYVDVFASLGFPIALDRVTLPERRPLTPRLLTLIGREPKKCIGIAPFAAYESKMYPLDRTKELIQMLAEEGQHQILLFGGGPEEEALLKQWESQFERVTNVAGVLTFDEELNLISNLDLMVSMDSANGHLAACFGIPVITLWGVTHPYAGFVPFAQPDDHQIKADRNKYPLIPTSVYGNKYPEDYKECMGSIPPEKVLEKIRSLL